MTGVTKEVTKEVTEVASTLAARGKSQTALRADVFRQLCVAKSAKYSSMSVVWRLDLAKHLSLSRSADFHHGLLEQSKAHNKLRSTTLSKPVGQGKGEEVMEMSVWIAKLLGPVLAVLAFPMLAFPKDLQKIAAEFLEQRALIWFTGLAVMTGGLAIVNTHNVSVADWPVIITLFGWAMLISGAGRLAFPHIIIRISNKDGSAPGNPDRRRGVDTVRRFPDL